MYHYKYLKYKTKYLKLKNQKGGSKFINTINRFEDELENYFNPIYGLCLYNTNFIDNMLLLYDNNILLNNSEYYLISIIIKKLFFTR